jgi:hypothetical protein
MFAFTLQLDADINVRKMEAQRESRKRDRLERELKDTKGQVEQKANELKNLQQSFDKARQDLGKIELQLKEQKALFDRALKDTDVTNARFQKLQHDYEQQLIHNDTLANENAQKVHELKVCYFPLGQSLLCINQSKIPEQFFFLSVASIQFYRKQETRRMILV